MSFCMAELIDTDIEPNPWEPAPGDVYSRPNPMVTADFRAWLVRMRPCGRMRLEQKPQEQP